MPRGKTYRCVKGFSYPVSLIIRDRIRAGDHMPISERGEWRRYTPGDKIINPPSDLIESWLRRGSVELAERASQPEEVPDDTQG
jgi:hypothetical protein